MAAGASLPRRQQPCALLLGHVSCCLGVEGAAVRTCRAHSRRGPHRTSERTARTGKSVTRHFSMQLLRQVSETLSQLRGREVRDAVMRSDLRQLKVEL